MKRFAALKIRHKLFTSFLFSLLLDIVLTATALTRAGMPIIVAAGAAAVLGNIFFFIILRKYVAEPAEALAGAEPSSDDEINAITRRVNDFQEQCEKLTDEITLLKNSEKERAVFESKLTGIINSFANGNFPNVTHADLSSGAELLTALGLLHGNYENFINQVKAAAQNAAEGNFADINPDGFEGLLRDAVLSSNKASARIKEFLASASLGLNGVSISSFGGNAASSSVFNDLLGKINVLSKTLSGLVSETSEIFHEISKSNFTVRYKADYLGVSAASIPSLEALEKLSANLSEALENADKHNRAVLGLDAQMQGITGRQSEITVAIAETSENISARIMKEAAAGDKAAKAATAALEKCDDGGRSLLALSGSMKEINASSNSISNIIKSIDDISFQTQLLSLNASIEAARAGLAGRGFSIVALRVGELAQKSKEAASETGTLLDGMLAKFRESLQISDKATKAFTELSQNIDAISVLLKESDSGREAELKMLAEISEKARELGGIVSELNATRGTLDDAFTTVNARPNQPFKSEYKAVFKPDTNKAAPNPVKKPEQAVNTSAPIFIERRQPLNSIQSSSAAKPFEVKQMTAVSPVQPKPVFTKPVSSAPIVKPAPKAAFAPSNPPVAKPVLTTTQKQPAERNTTATFTPSKPATAPAIAKPSPQIAFQAKPSAQNNKPLAGITAPTLSPAKPSASPIKQKPPVQKASAPSAVSQPAPQKTSSTPQKPVRVGTLDPSMEYNKKDFGKY